MRKDSQLIQLSKLIEDQDKVQEIGSAIIRAAAAAALRERLGMKEPNPNVVREVRAGEKVPADLIGSGGLEVDDGVAQSDWSKSYLLAFFWNRVWSESSGKAEFPIPDITEIRGKLLAEVELTEDELAAVQQLKILDEPS